MASYTYQVQFGSKWSTIAIYSSPSQFSGEFHAADRSKAWRILDDANKIVRSYTPPATPARPKVQTPWKGSWAALMAEERRQRQSAA